MSIYILTPRWTFIPLSISICITIVHNFHLLYMSKMATDRCSTCAYCSPCEAKLGCHAVSTYTHPDSCRVRDWRPGVLWMQRMWWNMLEPIPNLSFNLWARLQLCGWHCGARGKMHPSRWVPWWALSTDTRLQSDRSEVLYSHNFSFSCQWNIWLSFRVRGIIFSIYNLDHAECPIEGQTYKECKGCDGTCVDPNPPCSGICVPGCSCDNNTVVHEGRCIPFDECPGEWRAQSHTMQWKDCGSLQSLIFGKCSCLFFVCQMISSTSLWTAQHVPSGVKNILNAKDVMEHVRSRL